MLQCTVEALSIHNSASEIHYTQLKESRCLHLPLGQGPYNHEKEADGQLLRADMGQG